MALSTLVALAIVGGLALVPFKYWMLRSWRTFGLLGGATVLVVLLDVLGVRPLPPLQTGLVAGAGLALFLRNESLWAMSHADRAFVDAYAAVRTDLKALEDVVESSSPATYQVRFSELIARLEQIEPPSQDWDALKKDTAEDLKKRLSALWTGAPIPDDELELFRREWQELEDRFRVLIRQKTNFWLPWP